MLDSPADSSVVAFDYLVFLYVVPQFEERLVFLADRPVPLSGENHFELLDDTDPCG